MKIQFESKRDLDGVLRFFIRVDGNTIKSFRGDKESEATDFYKAVVERAKNGYPITEILAEVEIDPSPKP